MKKLVIGSKFSGHDSSIFIIEEGKEAFALQTERITRFKHDGLYPIPVLKRYMQYSGTSGFEVDKVIFCSSFKKGFHEASIWADQYENDLAFRKHFQASYKKEFDAAHELYRNSDGLKKFFNLLRSFSGWFLLYSRIKRKIGLTPKITMEEVISNHLKNIFPRAEITMEYYDHEYCHAVCTLVTSPFDEALLISLDGWGDDDFSRVYYAQGGALQRIAISPKKYITPIMRIDKEGIPCSLGGIYTFFTEMLGFTPLADEGKVEALAAYGKPSSSLLEELQALVTFDDLSIEINKEKFSALIEKFPTLLQLHMKEDLSATVQRFLEEVSLEYAARLVKHTGKKNIALAGGIAANVINNLLLFEKITKNLHITPAMADDGSAQGAAYAYLLSQGKSLKELRSYTPVMPYLETSYTKEAVEEALKRRGLMYENLGETWPVRAARLVHEGKIGALYRGRMEWGPRALGNRSILADPRRKDFRERLNRSIKKRPAFQPFCPSILAEEKDRLFESAYLNKHMTCAFRLKKEFWEELPSAMHIDGTARVQFVEESDNPGYFSLLKEVKELTGYGVVINTSFNKHGRTIVESPDDAIDDFLDTDMDYLIMEEYLVERK